ncbi:MAG: thioredoxin fold domain-containing protein [Gammaproteobacteria bacterium]|nr:thioredoxin fold domain-containing protein [Gammaproteobacteria bacterium]MCW8986132.1 thioredoxin fold domain-containing protein [Gammaproteobacteria bacterium]MCW9030629.1 thioredoxin fold domain-containing protein [Gammaproteobacteria bacterium]
MKIKIQPAVFLFIFSTLLSSVWAASTNELDPYKHFFNETWGDLPEELKTAKQSNKKAILIFFEMDECPFCHYMKKNVLNQANVQEYYRKHFLNFSIDIEGDVEMVNLNGKTTKLKDFAFKEHRVRATPVIAFFDLDGKRIYRHTGKTSGVDEFMWLGEFIAEGLYKKMRFSAYKKQKRAEMISK